MTNDYIYLMIDYRTPTLRWGPWKDGDKEGTEYNLFTGERALYTFYKVKNSFFDIYETLITDMWANEYVLYNKDNPNKVSFGDRHTFRLDEQRIYEKSLFDDEAYVIYEQNKATGRLERI